MSEDELIESGFEKVIVTAEESGNKNDYYYYKYEINDDVILMSSENDATVNKQWKVYEHTWGVAMIDIEDVSLLVNLFKKWSKIPL
jgi:hypothetical protein